MGRGTVVCQKNVEVFDNGSEDRESGAAAQIERGRGLFKACVSMLTKEYKRPSALTKEEPAGIEQHAGAHTLVKFARARMDADQRTRQPADYSIGLPTILGPQ